MREREEKDLWIQKEVKGEKNERKDEEGGKKKRHGKRGC